MIECPNLTISLFSSIRRQPECNRGKLVENGGVNILIIGCLNVRKAAKSMLSKNNRKELSVGYLLKLSSNQHPGKLEELFKKRYQKRKFRAMTKVKLVSAHLKDEIFSCMCCEVFGARVFFPKRIKGIDDPVVFIKEECVNGSEGRLNNSSGVPACQVFLGRVAIVGWRSKATLTPTW